MYKKTACLGLAHMERLQLPVGDSRAKTGNREELIETGLISLRLSSSQRRQGWNGLSWEAVCPPFGEVTKRRLGTPFWKEIIRRTRGPF